MITTIESIVGYWYKSGFEAYSTVHSGIANWGKKTIGENYLSKYGLYDNDFGAWKELQKSLFYLDRQLPSMLFKKNFEFISLLGGMMFEQKDFDQFKSCLRQLGESHFFIFQDTFGMPSEQKQYALNMKYPSDTNWHELLNGSFISTILFDAYPNNYFVFGSSGAWGIYVANDYVDESVNSAGTPIRIVGFDPQYRSIFRNAFEIPIGEYSEDLSHISEEERPDLKEWVPENYRNEKP